MENMGIIAFAMAIIAFSLAASFHARLSKLEKKLKDFDVIPEEFDSSEDPPSRWVAKMQRRQRGVTQEDRSD